jgi:hypothetical protein
VFEVKLEVLGKIVLNILESALQLIVARLFTFVEEKHDGGVAEKALTLPGGIDC